MTITSHPFFTTVGYLDDGSVPQPIGRLEDVPVNIGDTWVLEDFIILDMAETD